MPKKKYKLDKLLEGITDENLHEEIFTGEDVGREWPKDDTGLESGLKKYQDEKNVSKKR
ncbi:hypothetical protein [Carboxylicivirga marina]|uniref:Uncharacterized protein n=1 Tax=Carboxylicivirga marina TaxID=2800988 RepID=A0ABS1HM80_9BACT|nr:hypothetical protein [Carboxylicivirga marina]MBK3518731.1 hypothetical protein [Carboxylicivirga marina]